MAALAVRHAPLRSRLGHRRQLELLPPCWPGGETRRGCLLLLGAWAQAALRTFVIVPFLTDEADTAD